MATLVVETQSGIPRHNLRHLASSVLVSHYCPGLIARWFQTASQGQQMSIVLVEQFYDFAAALKRPLGVAVRRAKNASQRRAHAGRRPTG
jgi:hypothetical protein